MYSHQLTHDVELYLVSERRGRLQADRVWRLGPPIVCYLDPRDKCRERGVYGAYHRNREDIKATLEIGQPGSLIFACSLTDMF